MEATQNTSLAEAREQERMRCLRIINTYKIPQGYTQEGRIAANWLGDALRTLCARIADPKKRAVPQNTRGK